MLISLLAVLALAPVTTGGDVKPAPAAKTAEVHGKLAWFTGTYEEALAKAKAENKLVFVDFWTTWCGWCKKLDKDTYTDDSVVSSMANLICFNIDAESEAGAPLAKKYGVKGYPALLILNADGSARDSIGGYLPPDKFKTEVQRVRDDKGTVGDLKRQWDATPTDLEKRYQFAKKLQDLGDNDAYDAHLAAIKKADPESKSLPMRRLAYETMIAQVNDLWTNKKQADSPKLVKDFLANETYPEILFQGWNTLAQIHMALTQQPGTEEAAAKAGRMEARTALKNAWKSCPADQQLGFGNVLASVMYEQKDEIAPEDKTFALDVAKKIAPLAETEKNADALDSIACVYFMNGKKDDAVRSVNLAIGIDAKNEEFPKHLKEFMGT